MHDNDKISPRLKSGRPQKAEDRRYQFDVCLWLAEGKTTRQIIDLLKDKYNIKMSFVNVDSNYRYSKKWRPVIEYLYRKYLKNIARVPIASKAYRLRLLQQAADESLKWRVKSRGAHGKVLEMKIGALPQIIAEARKEVEGEKPLVVSNVSIVNNNLKVLKDDDIDGMVNGIIARRQRAASAPVRGEISSTPS